MTAPKGGPPGDRRSQTPYIGGADAVPDTPDVAGKGTEPEENQRERVPTPTAGRGIPVYAWIAIVIAVLVIIAYAVGFF